MALAAHPKWEVRKAVAGAIPYLRHQTFHAVVARLVKDDNAFVQEAARRSLARRSELTRADILTEQHGDLLLGWLADLEAGHGPRARRDAIRVAEKYAGLFVREARHEIVKVIAPLDLSLTNLAAHLEGRRLDRKNSREHVARAQERVRLLTAIIDSLLDLTTEVTPAFERENLRSVIAITPDSGPQRRFNFNAKYGPNFTPRGVSKDARCAMSSRLSNLRFVKPVLCSVAVVVSLVACSASERRRPSPSARERDVVLAKRDCRHEAAANTPARYDKIVQSSSDLIDIKIQPSGSVGWNISLRNSSSADKQVLWDESRFVDAYGRSYQLSTPDECELPKVDVIRPREQISEEVVPMSWVRFAESPVDIDEYLIGGRLDIVIGDGGHLTTFANNIASSSAFFCAYSVDGTALDCFKYRSHCSRYRISSDTPVYVHECRPSGSAYCTVEQNQTGAACAGDIERCELLRVELQHSRRVFSTPCESHQTFPGFPATTQP